MYKNYISQFVIELLEYAMLKSAFVKNCVTTAYTRFQEPNPFVEKKIKIDCDPMYGKLKPPYKKHYVN